MIRLVDIEEIKSVSKPEIGSGIRTFGVGGCFGYFGKFIFSKIGRVTLYATQRKNLVLIQTKEGKNIIITPDDVSLVEMVKEKKQ